jgi:hypothetical protein
MLCVLLKCVCDTLKVISHNTLLPKQIYPHELQKNEENNILQTKSRDNLADLLTKSLPKTGFQKCIHDIAMRRLRNLQNSRGKFPRAKLTK